MTEDSNNAVSSSFLLDDNSRWVFNQLFFRQVVYHRSTLSILPFWFTASPSRSKTSRTRCKRKISPAWSLPTNYSRTLPSNFYTSKAKNGSSRLFLSSFLVCWVAPAARKCCFCILPQRKVPLLEIYLFIQSVIVYILLYWDWGLGDNYNFGYFGYSVHYFIES